MARAVKYKVCYPKLSKRDFSTIMNWIRNESETSYLLQRIRTNLHVSKIKFI